MKFIPIYLMILFIIGLSSCINKTSSKKNITINNDTITTTSGLKYCFLKKGKGPKIVKGSKVSTYLNLQVEGKTVWNTDKMPDSVFTFIADYTKLIKGFTEVCMKLSEGDEIIAILPSNIAYGSKGSGSYIPPNSTLVYDKFKVIKVEEPKLFVSDSLIRIYKKSGIESMLKFYHNFKTKKEAEQYYTDEEQLLTLWYILTEEGKHKAAAEYATKVGYSEKSIRLKLKALKSYNQLGEKAKALNLITNLHKENPKDDYIKSLYNSYKQK